MKKKKGFTLVELLAVIVILAIVLIIAVPGVLSIINKTKSSAYDRQIDMIKEATRNYVTTSNQVQWKDNQTVVNLTDLQGQGLLDKKIINPKDKSEIHGLAVIVTRSNNKLTYEIVSSDPSNANYPVYNQAMIPIRYDGTNWVKADPTNKNQTWFDYTKQQWANVATVTEDVRQSLLDAPVDTPVPMDKINTMFVWIPRFKYKLFNVDGTVSPVGNANMAGDYMIDVKFEGKETPKSAGTQNGQWLTHPAFTFGEQELSGLWVGKFETGNSTATAPTDTSYNYVDATKIVVKPNAYSWKYQTTYHIFKNSQSMKEVSTFGITSAEDPHMMKNMEWGAMAYLTSSPYGKEGNPNYSGEEKEVRLNNNENLTGCGADTQNAAGPVATCNQYDTVQGQAASTTGNITGIYDAVGGSNDYVASIMENKDGTYIVGKSEFPLSVLEQVIKENKYLDVYEEKLDVLSIEKRKLGDATKEMGTITDDATIGPVSPWRTDRARFITSITPWFYRGGSWEIQQRTGIMAYNGYTGQPFNNASRIVLI